MPEETQAPTNLSEEQILGIVKSSEKAFHKTILSKLRHAQGKVLHLPKLGKVVSVGPKSGRLPDLQRESGAKAAASENDAVLPLSRVEGIAGAVNRATEVFGDSEKAMRWLNAPIPSIGETPMALLRTVEGAAQVEARRH